MLIDKINRWGRRVLSVIAVLAAIGICLAGPTQVSTMTAGGVIEDVRAYLNEDTEDFYKDAQLLQWINDGQQDIAAKALCTEVTEDISLTPNTIEYTPTTDYIAVLAAIYTNASGVKEALKPSNIRSVGEEDSTVPGYFYDFGGKVGVYPALTSVTSESVTFYFVQRPSVLTQGDTISIPALYTKALTLYVVSQAMIRDKRDWTSIYNAYLQEIAQYRQNLSSADKQQEKVK